MTAHHRDDQAETVLLQLLRGAGVRGLAAMPIRRKALGGTRRAEGGTQKRAGGRREEEGGRRKAEGPNSKAEGEGTIVHPSILRPLLDTPRSEIERYARARGLSWVEDESNEDKAYARNFLRHELLPVLERRFPAYRATLARSARHLGEVAQLLDELAAVDAAGAAGAGTITAEVLKQLSPARASNLLRWFLRERGVAAPATEHVGEMVRQIVGAQEGARLKLRLEEHDLYRWRGVLHLVRRCPPGAFLRRKWRAEGRIELPELGGVLHMDRNRGVGISLERLEGRGLSVGVRRGGERLQPDCRRPRRTLKNLLQEHGIPPWERERLPLLYCGDELVWVPHIGVDCAYQAGRGERSVNPVWQPCSFA
jgi:tRNA(Ile)-lysidine synthase